MSEEISTHQNRPTREIYRKTLPKINKEKELLKKTNRRDPLTKKTFFDGYCSTVQGLLEPHKSIQ